jgi:hypothetical protein
MKASLLCLAWLMFAATPARAQHRSLDIGVANTGVSIGNSAVWNGLRLNWRDVDVDRVTGLNLTIWRPGANPDFDMYGLALGILGPDAARTRGITIGIAGSVTHESMHGIALAGLAVVSEGELAGISLGGLAVVTGRRAAGVQISGLGTVSRGDLLGINVSGLGTVARGRMVGLNLGGLAVVGSRGLYGVNLGGLAAVGGPMGGLSLGGLAVVSEADILGLAAGALAVVAERNILGIAAGGLAVVSSRRIRGIAAGGLAVVAQDGINGAALGGLAVVSPQGGITGTAATLGRIHADSLRGIAFGAYRVTAANAAGIVTSIAWNDLDNVSGLSVAAYNRARGTQRGLAIGIFNNAETLHGIQLGILNRAGNNTGIFRVLPLLNVHFE